MGFATVVTVLAVAAASAAGFAKAPSRAYALTENLPQGAIGVGAQTAPSASPMSGAAKMGGAKSFNSRAKQAKAFRQVVAKKKAYDAEQARKRREAARRAAALKAARRLRWKSAKCSTYGIGDGLVGHNMASGGKLRSDSMVVAHKSLPFGTKIKFQYHGRTTIAVVKDRGPYVHGRVFDLGPGTAKALRFNGVGYVKYAIIRK